MKKSKIFSPAFKTPEDEVAYLKDKVSFLIEHAHMLADMDLIKQVDSVKVDLIELQNIKNSKSWRLTKPLRDLSYFVQKIKRRTQI